MRSRGRSLLVGIFLGSSSACVDLFHSTSFPTLCDADASDPACDAGATVAALCAASPVMAKQQAVSACARLAACEGALGSSRTGECMARATLAYDCRANPNQAPVGRAAAFWRALRDAKTCDDVRRATAPAGRQPCASSGFAGCAGGGSASANDSSRIDCAVAASEHYENCAAYGQTCTATAANEHSKCGGLTGRRCSKAMCAGTYLVLCDDAGVDIGFDCAEFGAGACGTSGQLGCAPTGSQSCAPSSMVQCHGDVATLCRSGTVETIDCGALVGPGGCKERGLAAGESLDQACRVAECDKDMCDPTRVNVLLACTRGHVVAIDCKSIGLGACRNDIQTVEEGVMAACGKSL